MFSTDAAAAPTPYLLTQHYIYHLTPTPPCQTPSPLKANLLGESLDMSVGIGLDCVFNRCLNHEAISFFTKSRSQSWATFLCGVCIFCPVSAGFVSSLRTQSKDMHVRWIWNFKLSVGVREWVNDCLSPLRFDTTTSPPNATPLNSREVRFCSARPLSSNLLFCPSSSYVFLFPLCPRLSSFLPSSPSLLLFSSIFLIPSSSSLLPWPTLLPNSLLPPPSPVLVSDGRDTFCLSSALVRLCHSIGGLASNNTQTPPREVGTHITCIQLPPPKHTHTHPLCPPRSLAAVRLRFLCRVASFLFSNIALSPQNIPATKGRIEWTVCGVFIWIWE